MNAKVFIDTIHRALPQTSLQNFKIYLAKANTLFYLIPGMNAGSILSDNYNMHLFLNFKSQSIIKVHSFFALKEFAT